MPGHDPRCRFCLERISGRQLGHRYLNHLGLSDAVLFKQCRKRGGTPEIQRVYHKLHMRVQPKHALDLLLHAGSPRE